MNITNLRLLESNVLKLEFEDFTHKIQENKRHSGFLRMSYTLDHYGETENDEFFVFFKGNISAHEGEEDNLTDEARQFFNLKVSLSLKYNGNYTPEDVKNIDESTEWHFNKDAGIALHGIINRFLADTPYRSINIPLQK
jgi:hypothetical protein